jgi:hypothetical protein
MMFNIHDLPSLWLPTQGITCLHSTHVLQHKIMQWARLIQSTKSEVDWPGFNSQQREGVFSLLPNPDQLTGPLSLLLSNWYQGHSPWEVKKTHSPPYSDEVKNAWAYDSTPSIVFMALYLMNIKAVRQCPCNWVQGHPHPSSPLLPAEEADHTLMLRSRMHGA